MGFKLKEESEDECLTERRCVYVLALTDSLLPYGVIKTDKKVVLKVCKHGACRPQKPMRLIRDGEKGGGVKGVWRWEEREIIYLSLHCHHQNDFCIKVGSDESHFNVS